MGRYRTTLICAVVLSLAGCRKGGDGPPGWELKPPAPDAAPVEARWKQIARYHAGSHIEDRDALGGFGPCDNYPWKLAGQEWGAAGAVSLVAFPDEPVAYSKHRGFALRLVNRTGKPVPFEAIDSALAISREAQDAGGAWREIEWPARQEICGNSFHRVFLGPGQYWQFPALEYAGPVKTKMRFRLDPGGGRPTIYSNVFEGLVTAGQLAGV